MTIEIQLMTSLNSRVDTVRNRQQAGLLPLKTREQERIGLPEDFTTILQDLQDELMAQGRLLKLPHKLQDAMDKRALGQL